MKKILIFCLVILGQQVVMADHTQRTKVYSLYVYSDVAIISTAEPADNTGCKYTNYFAVTDISGKNKAMYSAVLTAHVTKKDLLISFTVGNCSSVWGTNSIISADSIVLY